MSERGRSPGAKGTAFPQAQRPQKAVPRPAKGASPGKGGSLFQGAGGPPPAAKPPLTRASLAGKTLSLPVRKGEATASDIASRGPQKKSANATSIGQANAGAGRPASVTAAASSPLSTGPTATFPALVRVSKLLAERGLCSRREADVYIERGWVQVDGQTVTELGTKASPDAALTLTPEAAQQQGLRMTLLLHKPVGYVSGQPEPGYQPAVVLIQPQNQARDPGDLAFEPRWMKGLAPAGRLDIDSTGLLVLTQDGRIARQLIGDDSTVDKEYLVRVEGRLITNGLALLNHGLSLDGKALRPARVEWLNDDQLRFILREGKKRQIRRMCELVGLTVVGLKRVRVGRVKLGDLPLGQWRYLRPDESF